MSATLLGQLVPSLEVLLPKWERYVPKEQQKTPEMFQAAKEGIQETLEFIKKVVGPITYLYLQYTASASYEKTWTNIWAGVIWWFNMLRPRFLSQQPISACREELLELPVSVGKTHGVGEDWSGEYWDGYKGIVALLHPPWQGLLTQTNDSNGYEDSTSYDP